MPVRADPRYGVPSEPPPETMRFLEGKGIKPSFSYKDVWQEEHAVAFTVAKAMQQDILLLLQRQVTEARKQGKTLQSVSERIDALIAACGLVGD